MKSNADFSLNPQFSLLIHGVPFAGKTNIAFQFPDPWFLDADDKLGNAVRRFPNKTFYYDCPLRNDDGTPVPGDLRWERCVNVFKAAAVETKVRTMVFDSVTSISAMLQQHILRFPATGKSLIVGGEKVMDQSMWGPYRDLLTKMIMASRATGKLVIWIAHDVVDKDEVSGSQLVRPSFSGQLRDTGAGLFTDVWHAETRAVVDGNGNVKTEYFIRTQPNGRTALGNSLGLPAEWVFNWSELEKRLGMLPAAPAPTLLEPPTQH